MSQIQYLKAKRKINTKELKFVNFYKYRFNPSILGNDKPTLLTTAYEPYTYSIDSTTECKGSRTIE